MAFAECLLVQAAPVSEKRPVRFFWHGCESEGGAVFTNQLGGRIMLNPWTSEVDLLRAAAVAPTTDREKNTLAVSPLIPYLRYAEAKSQTTGK